jgi:hypothetical protein
LGQAWQPTFSILKFIVQALSGQDITVFGDWDPQFLLSG